MSRVYFRGQAQAVVLLINLTQRWRKTQQMQLVNEMGRFFQASLDINKVLYTVLTCVTAGPALGFNRAFLLLLHEESDTLKGAMALGPSSAEEAARIWRDLGQRQLSLQEILADETAFDPAHPTPLQHQTLALKIDLQQPGFESLRQVVHERRTLRAARDELIGPGFHTTTEQGLTHDEREALLGLFTASEVAIAPLASKDRIVGVVLADNLYSAAPIEEDDLRLLETVAQQAGLTIDNALTYQALQKAQKELVSAERLVAVGEMAARVSHEIRNPLATVGGFARSILKRPEDVDAVKRKVGVIVDEVSRLEELLSDLLDMARARDLDMQAHGINEIVEHALLLADADIKASGVEVKKEFAPDLPPLMVDRRRLLQALLNTIRNGAQAMPDGGVLGVVTRVRHSDDQRVRLEIEVSDTGVGIPPRALKQVFDPFFSTKIRGSGLGLAVTLRIIRDHGGDIDVYSDEGQGTTFVMCLPLQRVTQESEVATV
jgi:signal transduction histidine kinase